MSEYNGILYAAPPPPGVIPDFNQPQNAQGLVISIYVLLPIAGALTALRAVTRIWMTRQHGLDDILMEIAMALAIAMGVITISMLRYGLGSHMWDVPLHLMFPEFMLRNLIIAMLFCAGSALSKVSILCTYLRLFTAGTIFRVAVFVTCAFVSGYGIATTLVNALSCNPINGSWDLAASATAKCINRPVFYLVQAGLGIVADFATLIIPVMPIVRLKMSTRVKVGVLSLLTLGTFVCVISLIRLKSLVALLKTDDLTRATPNALMWCVLELNLSIIGGNVPAIKQFFKKYMPFLVSRTTYSRSRSVQPSKYMLSQQPNNNSSHISKTITVSVIRTHQGEADSDSVQELVHMRDHARAQSPNSWPLSYGHQLKT